MAGKWKACLHCTQAKRKCGKEEPACGRCLGKGVPCTYPSPQTQVTRSLRPRPPPVTRSPPNDIQILFSPTLPVLIPPSELQLPNDPWFIAEESWALEDGSENDPPETAAQVEPLYRYLDELASWIRRWVLDGSNPFIHARLYEGQLPECIQDAYTTAAAYIAKTEPTGRMVLRMVENRAAGLVQDGSVALDTYCHLARTQSLFIYVLLLLADGDIRARSQGEVLAETLTQWLSDLWESTGYDVKGAPANPGGNLFRIDGSVASVWKAWVVAESIKRTYLAARIMLATYCTLRYGSSVCPGGLTYTARRGLWTAGSPRAWVDAITEGGGMLPLRSVKCGNLFMDAAPVDVDDFTGAVLMISHSVERVERWHAGGRDGLSLGTW